MDMDWKQEYLFNTNDLKKTNPIPELVEGLKERLPSISTSEITTILTELYNNCLDHGILELSSQIKQQHGLQEYYNVRKQKLADLVSGSIHLMLSYYSEENVLTIKILDSGKGFNHAQYSSAPLMLHKVSGKGLYIVHRIAEKVEYTASGNGMTVYYKVRPDERKAAIARDVFQVEKAALNKH